MAVLSLEDPEATKSTEWSMVWLEEGTEATLDQYETLLGSLRWRKGTTRRQIIVTTNPGDPGHFLNQRAERGGMRRFITRHEDNPTLWDHDRGDWTEFGREYIATLDRYTGVRYLRLRKGIWAGAEGMVYEAEWDPAANVIGWDSPAIPRGRDGKVAFRYYVVGVDWGYTEPGVFQVWGVDGDGRMFLVREVYRSGLAMGPLASGSESWMSIARRLDDEYHPDAWICDPARPEHIDQFRHYGIPAKEADNRRETGIEGVRRRMVKAGDGLPRLFVLRDALESRDQALERAGKPMGFIGEIPQYTYLAPKNEKPTDDRTDPKKADHSMDAARYACAWVDRHHVAERDDGEYAPWSCGDVLRHDELV